MCGETLADQISVLVFGGCFLALIAIVCLQQRRLRRLQAGRPQRGLELGREEPQAG